MTPLYAARAGGLGWLNLMNAIVLLAVVVALVLAFVVDDAAAIWVTIPLVLATDLFIWAIVPRDLEVFSDRLRLRFPFFKWDLGFDTIESVREAPLWQAYGYWGVRFATSPGQAIEVKRKDARMLGRPNVIISPEDREPFLSALNSALRSWQQRKA